MNWFLHNCALQATLVYWLLYIIAETLKSHISFSVHCNIIGETACEERIIAGSQLLFRVHSILIRGFVRVISQ